MNKQRTPQTLLATLAVAGVFLASATHAADPSPPLRKPNFLVILVDDMGYSDPGFMGGEIATPTLDRLASEGLVMTRGMNCAVCSPSRATLLTGVYSHRAGFPSLVGSLNPDFPTLAELLKPLGYRTLLSGKWHLQHSGVTPEKRGFDKFFGLIGGSASHWNPSWAKGHSPAKPPGEPVYSSDAIADNAIAFLKETQDSGKPFFLYYAFTAPHFPIHAPKALIDQYEDRYRMGWDAIRQARWEKQRKIGLFPESAQLPTDRIIGPKLQDTDWAGKPVPEWSGLSADRQADLVRRMATYAAMVHQVDVNIGRLLDYLKEVGQLDNTVIFFASDNGSCAQGGAFGRGEVNNYMKKAGTSEPLTGSDLAKFGGPDSDETLGAGWARTSNTPLRYSKAHAHAGGNTTPLLVWGAPVRNRAGQYNATPCHLMDIAPTCLALAGVNPPPTGFDGISLVNVFNGKPLPDRTLFFELYGEAAVVTSRWRMVKPGTAWELYDERADPSESADVAKEHPEVVRDLSTAHAAWFKSLPVWDLSPGWPSRPLRQLQSQPTTTGKPADKPSNENSPVDPNKKERNK